MDTAQLLEVIESYTDEYGDEGFSAFSGALDEDQKAELSVGTAEYVDSYGGEGLGDELWVVFRLNGELYKLDGYYSSWGGEEWGDGVLTNVEPYEVTITRYREKP